MRYTIPLVFDAKGNDKGLFAAFTTSGPIIFIFSSGPRWTRFAGAVSTVLATRGEKLAAATLEADSLEEIVELVAGIDPAIAPDATFLPDSAPIFEDVARYFEQEAKGASKRVRGR